MTNTDANALRQNRIRELERELPADQAEVHYDKPARLRLTEWGHSDHLNILKAIETIDRKILCLQRARSMLALEIGMPVDNPAEPKGRKSLLADFLRANGPMTRRAIAVGSGFPESTISWCLNDKGFFTQLNNGQWFVAETPGEDGERVNAG